MSFVGSNILAGASGQGGSGYQIDRSLRFNRADSANLSRTPSSEGNRRTWTLSLWVKRSDLESTLQGLFGAGVNDYDYTGLYFQNDELKLEDYPGGGIVRTQPVVLRDVSAWYHIVVAVDTTQSTAANRVKFYLNGVQLTTSGTWAQNTQTRFNKTQVHKIGKFYPSGGSNEHFTGYLAEVYFIDGQALAATDFGEPDSNNNVWQPKAYEGNYDTSVDQSATWSNLVSTSSTLRTGSGAFAYGTLTTIFDGNLGTGVGTTSGNLTLNFSSGISTSNSTVEVYVYHTYAATITAGGNTYTTNTGSAGATEWLKVTGVSGTITQITVNGSGSVGTCGGIKIDGQLLVDPGLTAKNNGFYLKFADNSSKAALGTDSSGNNNTWTVNNFLAAAGGSATLSISGYSNNLGSYPLSNVYDGNTSTRVLGTVGGPGTVSFSPALTGVTSLRVYQQNYTHYLNGSVVTPSASSGSPGWHTLHSGSAITLSSFGNAYNTDATQSIDLYAFEINGIVITSQSFSLGAASDVDSLIDTPTDYTSSPNNAGNYCTLNPLYGNGALSNGNLDATATGEWQGNAGTIGMSSGKFYWEIDNVTGNELMVGIIKAGIPTLTWNTTYAYSSFGSFYPAAGGVSYGAAWTTGDVIGIAFDADNGSLSFYKNGVSQGVATTGLTDGPYLPSVVVNGSSRSCSVNFGQRAFTYTNAGTNRPAATYQSLCTTNLPDPTIADGSTVFDIALWTGNNSTQSLTGFNFSPDLFWSKSRSTTWNNGIHDIVRGPNKLLRVDTNGAEYTAASPNESITSFNSDGVTFGPDGAAATVNYTGTYVGWAWDAGTASSNDVGDYWTATQQPKYLAFKFPTSSGGRAVFGLTSGTGYADIYTSSDNSSWTRVQSVTLSTTDTTYDSSAQYLAVINTSNAVWGSTAYAMATSGTDLHFSNQTYPGSGASFSWSGPAYSDWDFRSSGTVIKPGSLNSSVYNQSYAITSNITSSGSLGGTLANWFNGQRANKLEPSGSGSLDFTGVSALQNFSGTLQFAVSAYSGSTSMKFVINASTDNITFTTNTFPSSSGGFPSQLLTIPVTSLRTLDFTSISGQSTQFWGMYLNGKLLVDSTATPDTVPSIASTVRANPTAGISIVSYSGTGSALTVGHGLNAAPEFLIVKNRSSVGSWFVYHKSIGATKYLNLDTTAAVATGALWGNTDPTSSVVSSSGASTGSSGQNYVMFAFSPVEGFSAIGSYVGNGSTNGPFVYTGFRPAWILYKRKDASGNDWTILDSTRGPTNVIDEYLQASNSNAENAHTMFDFLSNGFKPRLTSAGHNASGGTYVYIAFAEHPFKTARAR